MATSVLHPSRIALGASARDRAEAIELVGSLLVRDGLADEGYVESMQEREASMSTYVGNGIAIPHGMTADLVRETGLAFAQFPSGIDFEGEKAYVLIGIAAKGEEHLGVLANLAAILEDESIACRLWTAASIQDVMNLLCGTPQQGGEGL